jgi:sarcosine oxidase subunit beta
MRKSDVLIVGGGLIGCATAWYLAREGAKVTLLDSGDFGMGASGQNAGSLHFQLERRFLENGDALAEQAARIAALSRIAISDWSSLEADLATDLHITMNGGLMVAETAEECALLERKITRENAEGLQTRMIDGDEARQIAPYLSEAICAAGYSPDEGHADARLVTHAIAIAADKAGAVLRPRCRVQSIEKAGRRYVISTAEEQFAASQILIACGAWSAHVAAMLNLHIPLFPVGLLMNATERVAQAVPHLVQHVGRRLSMKQTHSGNLLIGGGWPSRMALDAEGRFALYRPPAVIESSLRDNLRVAIDVAPMIATISLIRSWTGITAISADQLPIVGEIPALPGCWVAGGGSAFTLGPTFARLIAQSMSGKKREELEIVAPSRFSHLNSFMGQ